MKFSYKSIFFFFAVLAIVACDPREEEGIVLGSLPEPTSFTMSVDPDNANKIIITNTSEGFSEIIWDITGGIGTSGTPNQSTLEHDTVFYPSMGTYDITLHGIKAGGNGTSFSTQTVNIAEDATIECDDSYSNLTNGCTNRCWRLSSAAGSIQVGPTELSGEWYSSPADGLDPSQENDSWCFGFDDLGWTYVNNGDTFSACSGFIPLTDYPVPTGVNYALVPSGTSFSDFQINLPDGVWMGVEDSGPTYQIVSISDTEMVLLAPIDPCDGSASNGWFTLTFIPA